jgi:hypothetical protein
VLDFSPVLAREEVALRCALFITIVGTRPVVLADEVSSEIARSFELPLQSLKIHQSWPED